MIFILLLLPSICCIVLGVKVNHLQKQVERLTALHNEYDLAINDDEKNYVFAAQSQAGILNECQIDGKSSTNAPAEEEDTEQSDTMYISQEACNEAETSGQEDVQTTELQNTRENENNPLKDGKYKGKLVYLTFDDGPSIYTDDILSILSDYDVKATFFVVGKEDDQAKKLYKKIIKEGHTLGMHSYSHKYSKIYNSLEDFDKDFTKLWNLLYDTTGYKPTIYRFPGGSDNLVNKNGMDDFIRYLNQKKIVYYDWNVLNGDATGVEYTQQQLIDNVLSGVEQKKVSIVLMHDSETKKGTVDSLPGLLDSLISEGAQLLPLDENVAPIQMIKADTIK